MSSKPAFSAVEYVIHRHDHSALLDEQAITLRADDEGAGLYFVLRNVGAAGDVRATLEELIAIAEAAKQMAAHLSEPVERA